MIENPVFARALAALELQPTTARSTDLVFEDDLPVRITLHPDEQTLLVDAFAFDASELGDEAGAAASRMLLQLNGLALNGRPFAVGLTPDGLVAVSVRSLLAEAGDGALAEPIAYAVTQAREVRSLLEALQSVDGGGLATFDA